MIESKLIVVIDTMFNKNGKKREDDERRQLWCKTNLWITACKIIGGSGDSVSE
jgi:hypothetical protein